MLSFSRVEGPMFITNALTLEFVLPVRWGLFYPPRAVFFFKVSGLNSLESELIWGEVKWSEVKWLSRVRLFATPWTRLLRPWDSPSRNTGVGCHFLLQEIFPTQGSNLGLSYCRQTLYHLSHQGLLKWVFNLDKLPLWTVHLYLCLAALDLCCFAQALSGPGERGAVLCCVWASDCSGFSCCWAQALGAYASVATVLGRRRCGAGA